jgi:hypothetical protein
MIEQRKAERIVRPGKGLRGRQAIQEDTPPNKTMLKLHSSLKKAKNSVLVQACTGRIRLAKFLYNRKVRGVLSAQCKRRGGEETPWHMALYCTEEGERRKHLRMKGQVNYRQLVGTAKGAKQLAEWMICSGRLCQLRLIRSLLYS